MGPTETGEDDLVACERIARIGYPDGEIETIHSSRLAVVMNLIVIVSSSKCSTAGLRRLYAVRQLHETQY